MARRGGRPRGPSIPSSAEVASSSNALDRARVRASGLEVESHRQTSEDPPTKRSEYDRDLDPFASSTRDGDGSSAPSWNREGDKGAFLVGELVAYRYAVHGYGGCQVATVIDETTGEEVSLWIMHQVLRNEFTDWGPQPGERIGVKYHGRKIPKDAKPDSKGYHAWTLRVDREGGVEDVPDFTRGAQSLVGLNQAPERATEPAPASTGAAEPTPAHPPHPEPEDQTGPDFDRGGSAEEPPNWGDDDIPF